MAHLSLSVSVSYMWCLDNGCSRHMPGKRGYLTDYVESFYGSVTFGDGAKNKVVGFGTLNVE